MEQGAHIGTSWQASVCGASAAVCAIGPSNVGAGDAGGAVGGNTGAG